MWAPWHLDVVTLLQGAVVLLLTSVLYQLLSYLARRRALAWVPGPPHIPLLGNLQLIGLKPTEIFKLKEDCFNKYGSIYKLWIFGEPKVFIRGSDYLKPLLSDKVNITKGDLYALVRQFVSDGIITSHGEKWRRTRRLATPAFHVERLDTLGELVWPHLNTLMTSIQESGQADFSCLDIFKCFALDSALAVLLGLDPESIKGMKEDQLCYIESAEKMSLMLVARVFNPLLNYKLVSKCLGTYDEGMKTIRDVHQFIDTIINAARSKKTSSSNKTVEDKSKEDLLECFLSSVSREEITEQDVHSEILHFIFAAFDTISATLEFTMFLLAKHPEIQEKLRNEVRELVGDRAGPEKCKGLLRLPYLDQVTKEAFRMMPPDVVTRRTVSPLHLPGGVLPVGTEVFIDIYNTHRDPQAWPNPLVFLPERFSPDAVRDPFSYIPFSAGPRNCIGNKYAAIVVKLVVAVIMCEFSVESDQRLSDLKLYSNIVLRVENGLLVRFIKLPTKMT